MSQYAIDTHALLWYLSNSRKLGKKASAVLDEADASNALIYIPSIVLAELFFLNVKLGNPIDFAVKFKELERSGQFVFVQQTAEDILDFKIDSAVSEMHDRIIVGVARRLNVPLLTVDQNITESALIEIIW